MTVKLSPIGNDAPFVDASGNPLSGGLMYTYTAGSDTPENTYTTSAGNVANANPIVLNSNGYPAASGSVVSIWLTASVNYKFVLKTSAGVTVWTRDNISGVNDVSADASEWVAGPAPTYVSATSFTLVGDQTSTFAVGRRLKTTNSGGTVYSTIITTAYTSLTTVTVVNDSGTLDAGLSAVSYALLASVGESAPPFGEVVPLTSVAGTNTITASAAVAAAGYRTLQAFVFIPAVTNTGATTININGLGAKNVFSYGAACIGGEIRVSVPCVIVYDGTQFNIISPYYASGTFTGTLTGCTTSPTVTVQYTIVGNQVTISIPAGLTGTSNTTAKTVTGMPVILRPARTSRFLTTTSDAGGAFVASTMVMATSGVMTFTTSANEAAWTASGTMTINEFTATYTLA